MAKFLISWVSEILKTNQGSRLTVVSCEAKKKHLTVIAIQSFQILHKYHLSITVYGVIFEGYNSLCIYGIGGFHS